LRERFILSTLLSIVWRKIKVFVVKARGNASEDNSLGKAVYLREKVEMFHVEHLPLMFKLLNFYALCPVIFIPSPSFAFPLILKRVVF